MDQLREYTTELNVYKTRMLEIKNQYQILTERTTEIRNQIRSIFRIPFHMCHNRPYILNIRSKAQVLINEYRQVKRETIHKKGELDSHITKIGMLERVISDNMIRLLRTTNVINEITSAAQILDSPEPTGGLVKALCIGINYIGTEYELAGCINDTQNIKKHLEATYPSCKDIVILCDDSSTSSEKPTRANILAKFDWLVSGLNPGENVFVSYSGHGGRIKDRNGDEVTGLDGCIFPLNGVTPEIITDDEIREYLVSKIPSGCKCFIVIDACHSGTMVDMRYKWESDAFGNVRYTEDKKYDKTMGHVVFLSGCKDEQYSMDTVDHTDNPAGALTWALLETWKRYGDKIKTKYLLWDVRNYLASRGFSQIPQLCTGRYEDLQTIFDLSS